MYILSANARTDLLSQGGLKFCRECAGSLEQAVLGGEPRGHLVCASCASPHYDSPMVVVNCFVACGKKLLWVRRGIEPRYGTWAIPGGFLETGETLAEGAARELREEAGVNLPPETLRFYMTGTVTFINQVYVAFRARVDSPECHPGVESLECQFFSREECPWDAMGYPEVRAAMDQAYDDLESGTYGIWHTELGGQGYRRHLVMDR